MCGVGVQYAFDAKLDDEDALSTTAGLNSANGAKDVAGAGIHNMSGRPLAPVRLDFYLRCQDCAHIPSIASGDLGTSA